MRFLSGLAFGAVLLLAVPAAAKTMAERSEARLARLLEGRVAGEAKDCINTVRENRLSTFEYVGIVYQDGDTIYVARVTDPAGLRRDFKPVVGFNGFRLCASEIGVAASRDGMIARLELGPFVAYSKQPQ